MNSQVVGVYAPNVFRTWQSGELPAFAGAPVSVQVVSQDVLDIFKCAVSKLEVSSRSTPKYQNHLVYIYWYAQQARMSSRHSTPQLNH